MDYSFEALQQFFGKEPGWISRNARPLVFEKIQDETWRNIARTAVGFVKTEYDKDQLPLTPRQVHYHLVNAGVGYSNTAVSAKSIITVLLRARIAKMIGWETISETDSLFYHSAPVGQDPETAIEEALEAAKFAAGVDPWDAMRKYVLVVTEKRELGPQLESVSDKYFVRMLCTRGYGMWTPIYRQIYDLKEAVDKGYDCYVLFVTDHDPSGLDIHRFGASILRNFWGLPIKDLRPMLNIDQVEEFGLVAAPTKVKDPRAKWYMGKFGHECWEVDALGKAEMRQKLSTCIESLIDQDVWDDTMADNEANMAKTEELARKMLGAES